VGRGAGVRIRGPIEPMLAKTVHRFPAQTGGLRFEPKWDGYRAISAVLDNGEVRIWSRRGTRLDHVFPELAGALFAGLPPGTCVDGEIIRWAHDRLDFPALQYRYAQRRQAAELAVTHPCHLVLFDLLESKTAGDLRSKPLRVRRRELEQLMARARPGSHLALGLHTDDPDVARSWFDDLAAVGVEGLVIKPADSPYLPGQRGWQKLKVHRVISAVVGGVTGSLAQPEALLLGRYEPSGKLRYIGRTSRLTPRQADEIAWHLMPAGSDHPWPDQIATTWRATPTSYVKVQPATVVDVQADVAENHGRIRHAVRYLRISDHAPDAIPLHVDLET